MKIYAWQPNEHDTGRPPEKWRFTHKRKWDKADTRRVTHKRILIRARQERTTKQNKAQLQRASTDSATKEKTQTNQKSESTLWNTGCREIVNINRKKDKTYEPLKFLA